MAEQWWPEAVRRPGPASKAGYFLGLTWPKNGDVKHSAEGFWPGIHSVLDDLNRRASWHFTIGYDRVEQHYPVDMNCWHGGDVDDDGGVRANIDCVGIEHLGQAGTPLTPYQIEMTAKLSRWLMDTRGITVVTRKTDGVGWKVLEHNEVSDVPTSCPSNRIQWPLVIAAITKTGDERVKYTDEVLDNVFKAILPQIGKALEVANLAAAATINHIATHPGGGATTTTMAEIAELQEKQAALDKDIREFKEAIARAAGNGS